MVSERRQHGRFYTPAAVADLAVSVTLGDVWPPKRVLDPSCGDGALLAAVRRRGLGAAALVGRDNDASAIAAARGALPGASLEVVDLFDTASTARFPAIIGNPPYVRNDRLDDGARERIAACLAASYPELDCRPVIARGDLAACALLRSAALLEDGGRLGFIVSAALLEADYSGPLWRALQTIGAVRDVVSAPEERWFSEAAVNTVILVFERGAPRAATRISRLRQKTVACAGRVGVADELATVADVFVDPSGSPRRWAHLLRAPRAWLDIESAPELVPLGEVAEIRRGITTGANDIFYLTGAQARAEKLEHPALAPLLRSAKGATSIAVNPDSIDALVLNAPADLTALPNVAAYLERHAAAAMRPTLKSRSPWWKLPRRPARIFMAKAYARRFVQRVSPVPIDCDQRAYAVMPRGDISIDLLGAILNGSLTALAIESLGRASMGEGALEWTVADARSLPILDPRRYSPTAIAAIAPLFRALSTRPIDTCDLEADRPDRLALDRALMTLSPRLASLADTIATSLAAAATAREARTHSMLAA